MEATVEHEPLAVERILAILRRRWWIITLATVLVAGATLGFSKLQPRRYTATATVQILSSPAIDPTTGLPLSSGSTVVDPTVQATAVQLISHQPRVAAATATALGHGLTGASVAADITVSQQTTTNLVDISATSTSPSLAAEIVNTYTRKYISTQNNRARASTQRALRLVETQLKSLSSQARAGSQGQALANQAETLRIASKIQSGGVQLLIPASVPTSPSSPKISENVALGLVVGLLLGLGLAFVVDRLDRRIRSLEELEQAFRLPLLATVPHHRDFSVAPGLDSPADQGHKEVFRLLRAYLRYFNVDRELRLLIVTSAQSGDGKTTVARNLAEAAREAGTRTLLLETDLRRPDLAQHYGLAQAPGLSEVLTGGATANAAVQSVPIALRVNGSRSEVRLDVLVAGHLPPNPGELLESRAMMDLLAWSSEHYGMVVVDTAPVAVVSDAMPLLPRADGVVLVSQVGRNSKEAAAFLRERLLGVRAPLLGIVANGVREKRAQGFGYGYGYGSYEARAAASEDPAAPVPASLD